MWVSPVSLTYATGLSYKVISTSLTGAQTFSHSSLGCHPHFQVECETGFDITGAPLAWTNLFPNFDNMGMALLVLLIACTCNGYTPYMVRGLPQLRLPIYHVHLQWLHH